MLSLQKSSQAVMLCEAVLQGCLRTVVSVSLCSVTLQSGFQSVSSVAQHIAEPLGRLQTVVPSCPVCRRSPEMPSGCGVCCTGMLQAVVLVALNTVDPRCSVFMGAD